MDPPDEPPRDHGPNHGSPADEFRTAMADLESSSSCAHPTRAAQHHARLLRLGSLSSAFAWNCLMRAYLRLLPSSPHPLRLFLLMSRSPASPDRYTLPLALKAAARLFSPALARQLHASALKRGLRLHEFSESGLIALYSKIGDFENARKLFDENPHRKLGSWNALLGGLSQAGRAADAVDLFLKLRREGLIPDDVTMVTIASACGSLGDLELARQIHKCALQARPRTEETTGPLLLLQNSILDMYGKCGRPDLAGAVFSRMRRRDVSSWTSMIMALGVHGHAADAVALFRRMLSCVRPNRVTFVAVLSACAHGGMAAEGMEIFKSMEREFGVLPTAAHYGCVVDMLGRVGRVAEARGVIEGAPAAAANCVVLGTLLGACEKHGCVEVAEWAAAKLAALEPGDDGPYVVLSNIYAAEGLWEEVARLRRVMRAKSMAKVPAYSSMASPPT